MLSQRRRPHLNREVAVFPRAQNARDPDAAWSSINRVRVSERLDQYQAPSDKHQFIAAVVLILITLLLVLFL